MGRFSLRLACTLWSYVLVSVSCFAGDRPPGASATSPDGRVRAEVALVEVNAQTTAPTYSITLAGHPVVLPSRLGVEMANGPGIGSNAEIEAVHSRMIHETYSQHPGKRSRVLNHCNEITIAFRERTEPPRRWELVIRAYDDGVALRYRFPAQSGWEVLRIAAERHADWLALGCRGLRPAAEGLHVVSRGPL